LASAVFQKNFAYVNAAWCVCEREREKREREREREREERERIGKAL
jgi:hypothetical protein